MKARRVKPFTARWHREAAALAMSYAPCILACVECFQPVVDGYCCRYCGSGEGGVSEDSYDHQPRAKAQP